MSKPEQIVIPVTATAATETTETMTFRNELSRDAFIINERAHGYEVRLNYLGSNSYGTELYEIKRTRR